MNKKQISSAIIYLIIALPLTGYITKIIWDAHNNDTDALNFCKEKGYEYGNLYSNRILCIKYDKLCKKNYCENTNKIEKEYTKEEWLKWRGYK